MNNPRRIQRHFVRALAAGALLAAAALPMAIATAASAAATPSLTSIAFTPSGAGNTIGVGATGTFTLTGVGFAGNGGSYSLTSTGPTGVTFSSEIETASTTTVTGDYSAVGATAGVGGLSFTDSANVVALTLASAFTVTPAPTFGTVSPNSIGITQGPETVSVTGTGFETGAVLSMANSVDSTTLKIGATTVAANGDSLTASVSATNAVSLGAATIGTYFVTVSNPDGGSVTSGAADFSVDLVTVSEVSPSALPAANGATTLTITGSGFEFGAAVETEAGCSTPLTFGYTTFVSPSELTVVATTTAAVPGAPCDITVINPGATPATYEPVPFATNTPAGNGPANPGVLTPGTGWFTLTDGLGAAATPSDVAPLVTASSALATAAIVPGSAGSALTLTGVGFSNDTTVAFTDGAGLVNNNVAATSCIASGGGTALTCVVTVTSGAVAGTDSVTATNGTGTSAPLAAGLFVAGPSITSMAPTAIVVGAPVGTSVALTGTGFTNTMTGVVTPQGGGALNGILQYVSATSANFVVTSSPNASDITTLAGSDSITLSQIVSAGVSVSSSPFNLTVDGPPVVTSAVTYATAGTSGVGVGAKAQGIVITGVGFSAGATVTAFMNTAAVADANVTVTVTAVNAAGTKITATVAVAAGDTNTAVGYTVTNTDGGKAVVSAYQFPITIDAGPTITSVAPSTGLAGATNAFTLTGTGYTAASVVSVDTNGSCGATTFVSATSLTVTCTLGVLETTASNMLVTNPDGGNASTVILPATTPTPPKKPAPFHVSGVHGRALAGHAVRVIITGSGFHGQPRITSSAAGTKAVVTKDTGKVLTVLVKTPASTKPGVKTFTITQGAHRAKVHYSVVK